MNALSFKQPWASLVVRGMPIMEKVDTGRGDGSYGVRGTNKVVLKDIDNRSWKTEFRGRIYVHASKKTDDLEPCLDFLVGKMGFPVLLVMEFFSPVFAPRGYILGEVDVVDCVQESPSPWFVGPFGLVLRNPTYYRTPVKCPGRLYFFEPAVPVNVPDADRITFEPLRDTLPQNASL